MIFWYFASKMSHSPKLFSINSNFYPYYFILLSENYIFFLVMWQIYSRSLNMGLRLRWVMLFPWTLWMVVVMGQKTTHSNLVQIRIMGGSRTFFLNHLITNIASFLDQLVKWIDLTSVTWFETSVDTWKTTLCQLCVVLSSTSNSMTFQGLSRPNSLIIKNPTQHSLRHDWRIINCSNTKNFLMRITRLYRSSEENK